MTAGEIEKCIDGFGADVYRFCLKLCPDKVDAEDLYQQTFLKALETEESLDWENNPKALFFSFAYHLWKSDRRKWARRNAIAPSGSFDEAEETVLHTEESVEEGYLQKELKVQIRQIMQTLPEKFQVPLLLYYLSDCSIEQIAAIIRKPPGTVKSRLFKGRTLMKKRLEDAGYGK